MDEALLRKNIVSMLADTGDALPPRVRRCPSCATPSSREAQQLRNVPIGLTLVGIGEGFGRHGLALSTS